MPEPKFTREEVAAQVAMIYRQAADLIDAGWCQHGFEEIRADGSEAFCMLGAIRRAARPHECQARDAAWMSACEHVWRTKDMYPPVFNDSLCRTAGEVSSLLRKMANAANADWEDLEIPDA